MALVLDEGEASVLGFVGCTGVHDDVYDPVSDLPHLRQDLLTLLGFGDPAHKQTAVVNAGTDAKEATISARKGEQRNDEIRFKQLRMNRLRD